MLQGIREHATGWISVVIFSILLLSMGLLGIRTYMNVSDVSNIAAKVNNASISRDQLAAALQRLQSQLQLSEHPLSPEAMSGLKSTVLQSLISEELLRQAAVSEGYRVSSLQTQALVKSMPQFRVNGVFSPDRFQQLIYASDFTPASFLEQLGTSLVVDQVRRGISATSLVTSSEASQAVALMGQKRHFSWLILDPKFLSSGLGWHPDISPKEIEAYYQANPAEFQAPEQVSLDYIYLSEKQLPKNATGENSYSRLREKLANLSYEHPDSLQLAAKELGLAVQSTPLFTRKNGGTNPVSSVSAVREVAFTPDIVSTDNNSDVIEIDATTSVVVHLKQHLPARLLPLDQVRPKVIARLQSLEVERKLKSLAQQMAVSLRYGASPAQVIAQYHGLVWQDSGWVTRENAKPAAAVRQVAFQLPVPQSASHMSYGVGSVGEGGYVVIALKEVSNANVAQDSAVYKKTHDQIESDIASIEYDMYKNSLANKAKIKITGDAV